MWEKTVMSDGKLVKTHDDICSKLFFAFMPINSRAHPKDETEVLKTVAKSQAEVTGDIAYKAGREAERDFILQNTDRDIRARKEGRREVVEWINKTFNEDITIAQMMATGTWQRQIKEWGIK